MIVRLHATRNARIKVINIATGSNSIALFKKGKWVPPLVDYEPNHGAPYWRSHVFGLAYRINDPSSIRLEGIKRIPSDESDKQN